MNHFESPLFLCSFLFSSHVYKRKKSITLTIENVKPNVRVTDKIRQSKLTITILRFEIPFRDRDWKTLDAYQLEKEFLYILKKKNNPFVFFSVVGYERKSSRHLIKISQEIFRI